jgi:hypothetical protein
MELSKRGKNASEHDVEALFTQTNAAILEGLKRTEETNIFMTPELLAN